MNPVRSCPGREKFRAGAQAIPVLQRCVFDFIVAGRLRPRPRQRRLDRLLPSGAK